MNFLAYCRDKLKEEAAFSLLEMMIVITISSLLTVIFIQLITDLYQKNEFFSLENDWQLDAYLAVDFIADQIKNSARVEIINKNEINIFSYYDQEYQWLKFSIYQSSGANNLGRSIGSDQLDFKDFGRNLALLDKIEDLRFEVVEPGLLKITLSVKEKNNKRTEKLTVSRLIKI